MTTFRYLTRGQWGFKVLAGRTPAPEAPLDPYLVWHHVGGAANMGNDAIAVFQLLNRIAHNKGHWGVDYDALGHYDFTNDVYTVGQGNWGERSAATLDLNEEGEAFCSCANFQLRAPHPAEIEGVAYGMELMVRAGLAIPAPQVIGHRDNPKHVGATQCPGDLAYPHLPTVRTKLAVRLGDATTPPDTGDADVTNEEIEKIAQRAAAHVWAYQVRLFREGTTTTASDMLTKIMLEAQDAADKPSDSGGASAAAIADELAKRLAS